MGKHPTALRLKGYQDWVTSQFLFQSRHNKYCDQKCDVKAVWGNAARELFGEGERGIPQGDPYRPSLPQRASAVRLGCEACGTK
jgi:hypothetical protein